ncbi:MAG: four helix bundle protein [Proteobacteria bacterium]|nr:MAG: four helix bundle protein [Pseudomonadota bacterium]
MSFASFSRPAYINSFRRIIMPFAFEELHVYQVALKWVALSNALTYTPRFNLKRTILDQLGRASLSIPLNIAEGNGRWHDAEKKQYFRIARGSIFECVAIIQVLKSIGEIPEPRFSECYSCLEQLSKMMAGLIKSVE